MMTIKDCINFVESHLEIRYATDNRAYQANTKITPNGVVNHSIGCAQPKADVIFRNMNVSSAGWAVTAILGDFHNSEGRILFVMPKDTKCWGCGKGSKGSWNSSRIQWEVCEPAGHTYAGGTMVNYDVAANQAYFDRMWKMLVCWNVYIANEFGIDPSNINDHTEAYKKGYGSNHSDMAQWLPRHGKSMDALRREVTEILNNPKNYVVEGDDDMITIEQFKALLVDYRKTLQDNDASKYSEEARVWARNNGLVQGGSTSEFNGMWEDLLTREQMVTILYRFAKMMGQA